MYCHKSKYAIMSLRYLYYHEINGYGSIQQFYSGVVPWLFQDEKDLRVIPRKECIKFQFMRPTDHV